MLGLFFHALHPLLRALLLSRHGLPADWDGRVLDCGMRLERLPGWIVDEDASVRSEVEEFRDKRPEDLWEMVRACARSAAWALAFHDEAQAVRDYREPLPESSTVALARLRNASR